MRLKLFAALMLLAACTGEVVKPGTSSIEGLIPATPTDPLNPDPNHVDPETCDETLTPVPVRRLTRGEYDRTVEELLGDTSRPGLHFPAEERGNGFGNDSSAQGVSVLLVEQYSKAADTLAATALATDKLAGFTQCDVEAVGEEMCARNVVTRFGARAFRRPMESDEVDDFTALFVTLRAQSGTSYQNALIGTVSAILQSPPFLFRVEQSDGPTTEWELASRLSYLLWGSMPDEALFAAAALGELQTEEGLAAQVDRMMQSPKARAMVASFHDVLFGLQAINSLSKSTSDYPSFSPELMGLLQKESRQFVDDAVWNADQSLGTILSGNYSFLNETLAKHYGVSGVTGPEFQKVQLDPTMRAGLLTQGGPMGLLTPGKHTNPVVRGVFIRRQLLCNSPPDPPPGVLAKEPEFAEDSTVRQRFEQHRTDPACAGCHILMDPLGFGFENYNGLGEWQTMDGNHPVDASGEVSGSDVDGPYVGAPAMLKKLSESNQVKSCMVKHWFSFSYGRASTTADACAMKRLNQAFANGNVPSLLRALTRTRVFAERQPEVTP